MTITAGAIAGLLAVRQDHFSVWLFLAAWAGIVLAHAANNLMNDLFDLDVGLDTKDYPRGLYAPHPVLSGMITRRGLGRATLLVNLLDLGLGAVLLVYRGWPVAVFAIVGFFLSAAYTAPPLRLKKRGLGELDVMIVWGPLMVAGTYYCATGHVPWQVVLASIPYGLLCVAVLMGKHIDKIPWDEPAGIRTLPVMLGQDRARFATRALMVAFYLVLVAAVGAEALPWPSLLAVAALPAFIKADAMLRRPRPEAPPPRFPIWPLWFAAGAFLHTRRAGALMVLGMAIAAVAGIVPSFS